MSTKHWHRVSVKNALFKKSTRNFMPYCIVCRGTNVFCTKLIILIPSCTGAGIDSAVCKYNVTRTSLIRTIRSRHESSTHLATGFAAYKILFYKTIIIIGGSNGGWAKCALLVQPIWGLILCTRGIFIGSGKDSVLTGATLSPFEK